MKTLLQSLPCDILGASNWRGCIIIFFIIDLTAICGNTLFPGLLWYFFLTSFFSQLLLLYLITKTQSLSDSFLFRTFLPYLPVSSSNNLILYHISINIWKPVGSKFKPSVQISGAAELHPELSFWNTPLTHCDYSKLNMTLKTILLFLQPEIWQSLWALWSLTHLVHSFLNQPWHPRTYISIFPADSYNISPFSFLNWYKIFQIGLPISSPHVCSSHINQWWILIEIWHHHTLGLPILPWFLTAPRIKIKFL